jgi:hypothetical protein
MDWFVSHPFADLVKLSFPKQLESHHWTAVFSRLPLPGDTSTTSVNRRHLDLLVRAAILKDPLVPSHFIQVLSHVQLLPPLIGPALSVLQHWLVDAKHAALPHATTADSVERTAFMATLRAAVPALLHLSRVLATTAGSMAGHATRFVQSKCWQCLQQLQVSSGREQPCG